MTNTMDKFDCNRDTVIDASAGTGKTYTITKLIVPRLLKELKCSLKNILIVTYTEKAAGELRDRIRKELTALARDTADAEEKSMLVREIETIDDAPIFTIHSFCQKTLSENTVYANCAKDMTVVDGDGALDTFIGKYIRDKLVREEGALFTYLCNTAQYTPDTFQNAIKSAIKKYYMNNGAENPDVISLVGLTEDEEQKYSRAVEIKTAPEVNGKRPRAPMNQKDMQRCFVIKHLPEIYNAWQDEIKSKNLQTYDNMIKIVHDAISVPDSKLLQVLKAQYKYAIIDEFQDTNKLQWNIFRQIFATDDAHHITIVGDPKQSIFSFQGADAAVYNVAKDYLTDTKNRNALTVDLDTNYRSSEPMINAINAMSRHLADDYHDSRFPSPDKNPIQPALLNGRQIAPVRVFLGDEDGDVSIEDTIVSKIIEYCTIGRDGKTTALQIWKKDKKTGKGRYDDVNFGDFTILVRKRWHADKIIAAMTRAEIPFMWHKDNSLFSNKEAADWLALLSAIQAPDFNSDNRAILRLALQTAFFDIGLDNVGHDKYNDLLCPERQLLLKWRVMAENRQYAKMINSIFAESAISERLAGYDKIQSLSKYNQIGDFILTNLVSKHLSVANVVKVLQQRLDNQKEDGEDDMAVEKPTDSNTVKLSTIHSAKGLEFPIVFYLTKKPSETETKRKTYVRVEHSRDENGADRSRLHITTGEPESETPVSKAEKKALGYVAITRASSLMFMDIQDDSLPMHELVAKYPKLFVRQDLDNTYTSARDILTRAVKDMTADTDDKLPGAIAMSAKKLYKHSYSSLAHPKSDRDEDANIITTDTSQRLDKEDAGDGAPASSRRCYDPDCGVRICDGVYDTVNIIDVSRDCRGAKYGTVIHEVFERIDFKFFETRDKSEIDAYLSKIVGDCCRRHFMDCHHGDIISFISNTMAAQFPEVIGANCTGGKFRLSSIGPKDKKTELEFDLNISRDVLLNYCNGFMDLVFVREVGGEKVYSILDWKTDLFTTDNDYADYDYLKSHTDDKYDIQRVLYSYCLIQWLGQFYPDRSPAEIFDRNFGGVYYVYVRGCNAGTGNGIYAHSWRDFDTLAASFKDVMTLIKGA